VTDAAFDPRVLAARGDYPSAYFHRRLTSAAGSSFWVYNPTRFLLEQYDFSGRLLRQARHALDGWYKEASARDPGMGEFQGNRLWVAQTASIEGVLWLVYQVRNESYRPGTADYKRAEPDAGQRDLVVEALDTRTMSVLAVARFPGLAVADVKQGTDLLAVYQPLGEYFSTYRVVRLRLTR
jgi:hypothetical protein